MTIEELKALVDSDEYFGWKLLTIAQGRNREDPESDQPYSKDYRPALAVWRDLAPEILALVEAVLEDDEKRFKGSFFVSPIIKAGRAVKAKLEAL